MAYTRAEFRDIIRQRLGWPTTDEFSSDDELNNLIRDSARELHGLLVTLHRAGTWGINASSIVSTANTAAYAVPSDFGRLVVAKLFYAQRLYPITRMDFANAVLTTQSMSWTPSNLSAAIVFTSSSGFNIFFDPPPAASGYVVTVTYVQAPPEFASDTDTSWMGEDEYIILDCMIKLLNQEEADVSALMAKKADYKQRLELEAGDLDLGQAHEVVDVQRADDWNDPAAAWFRRY